jgi:hypothetical protein
MSLNGREFDIRPICFTAEKGWGLELFQQRLSCLESRQNWTLQISTMGNQSGQ